MGVDQYELRSAIRECRRDEDFDDSQDHLSSNTLISQRSSSRLIPPLEQDIPEPQIPEQRAVQKSFLRHLHDSWIREIGAAALSVMSLVLLAAFLWKINGTLYSSWQYSISPNSVVSVIITVTEGAMLVVVSSCLSQLKWNQYRKSAPLYNMQAIDQASRGPMGSLRLLGSSLRQPSKIDSFTLVGAFITILALAIDPFVQQILVFPTRTFTSTNETASIQATHKYVTSSSTPFNDGTVAGLATPMMASIMSGLVQESKTLEPNCSSNSCHFPEFVTVGICSRCANVTARTNQTCLPGPDLASSESNTSWTNDILTDCTYTSPSGLQLTVPLDAASGHGSTESSMVSFELEYWRTITKSFGPAFDVDISIISLLAAEYDGTAVVYVPENATTPMPKPNLTECVVYYCEKQYEESIYVPPDYSVNISKTQPLVPLNLTGASLVPLGAKDGTTLSKNSSYYIDSTTYDLLSSTLQEMLNTSLLLDTETEEVQNQDLSNVLYTNGIGPSLESMSTSMTDALRNDSLAYGVPGTTYASASFIDVRWPWIILPLSALLLTILLLVGTIFASKRHHTVLWKSSILPLLVSRLEVMPEDDITGSLRNLDDMYRASKGVDATMDQDRGLFYLLRRRDNPAN